MTAQMEVNVLAAAIGMERDACFLFVCFARREFNP